MVSFVQICSCSDSHVEKNTNCFGYHLSQPSGSRVLKVEFPLRNGFRMDDMAHGVSLNCLRNTDLHIMGVQTPHVYAAIAPRVFHMGLRHGLRVRPISGQSRVTGSTKKLRFRGSGIRLEVGGKSNQQNPTIAGTDGFPAATYGNLGRLKTAMVTSEIMEWGSKLSGCTTTPWGKWSYRS